MREADGEQEGDAGGEGDETRLAFTLPTVMRTSLPRTMRFEADDWPQPPPPNGIDERPKSRAA